MRKLRGINIEQTTSSNEGITRSVLKAISWRIVGSIDTFILSFLVIRVLPDWFTNSSLTDNTEIAIVAGSIAIIEVLTKIVLYTFHEQIWSRVKWGMVSSDDGMVEGKLRSLVKTGTWRVIAFADTTFLVWYFTGDVATAFSVGFLEILSKLVMYYLHERLWNRFR